MEWYLIAWKRSADFSGRSRRKEYWIFMLSHAVVFLVLESAVLALSKAHVPALTTSFFFLCFVYAPTATVPGLAVSVRRLHDIGKSGWWMLLSFVPVLGLLLIVFFAFDSEPGGNLYGPNPKSPAPFAVTG
jgi:uncharacterized membrane protein YhaH (DUF805 family)